MKRKKKDLIREFHETLPLMEQGLTMYSQQYPPTLWRFYKNCVTEGFTSIQAFSLTTEMLATMLGKGKPIGPAPDPEEEGEG